jgi:hypothetical protein
MMMEYTIKLNEDEKQNLREILDLPEFYSALQEFRQYLRTLSKHDSDRVSTMHPQDLLDEIIEHFYAELQEFVDR